MSIKEVAFKVEQLRTEAEKVHGFQLALFEAIYNGSCAPEHYEWAFVLFGEVVSSLKDGLKETQDELFEIIRMGKQGEL